jgi:hypothetical protein
VVSWRSDISSGLPQLARRAESWLQAEDKGEQEQGYGERW